MDSVRNGNVKRHIGWIFWLLLSLACSASEIVAWKVPLSRFAWAGLESQGLIRMKTAPETSPFFRDGDELWDLQGVPVKDQSMEEMSISPQPLRINTDPALEWLVWNASSGRLVTKANWNAIWQLHQQLRIDQLPTQLRLTLKVFEIPVDGAVPSEESVPVASLTWMARSGSKFSASSQRGSDMIQVGGGATANELGSMIDLALNVGCAVRGQPGLQFDLGLVLRPENPCRVARDFDGRTGLDCSVSGRIELVDGTPLKEAVLIQNGNAFEPLQEDRSGPMRHRVGESGRLMSVWMDPVNVASLISSGPDLSKDMDPFAETPPEVVRESLKLNEVMVPDCLKAWFPRPVWDLRMHIKRSGIGLNDSDFAGYDPFSRRVFLFSNQETEIDKFEQLMSPGCMLSPRMIAVSMEGNGQSRIVTRSGQKGIWSAL